MDKVVKKKWVSALCSGEYRQATEQLKGPLPGRHVGHCCLGVLCDVVDKSKWDRYDYDGCDTSLPNDLRGTLGITSAQEYDLIQMNDSENKSFREIAKYIQENM